MAWMQRGRRLRGGFWVFLIGALALNPVCVWGEKFAEWFPHPVYLTLKRGKAVFVAPAAASWHAPSGTLYDALTPDGKLLLATSPFLGKLFFFETQSGALIASIALGQGPKGISVAPNGRTAYVADETGAAIFVVDIEKKKAIARIPMPAKPHNSCFSRDGAEAYVTLQTGNAIAVINARQHKVIDLIPTPGLAAPHNLALAPDGRHLFVRGAEGQVAKIDLKARKVEKVVRIGEGHAGIAVSADGRRVFTADTRSDSVWILDAETLAVEHRIQVGASPHGVRVSSDGRWLYVAVTGADRLAVVDLEASQVIHQEPVSGAPFWIATIGG